MPAARRTAALALALAAVPAGAARAQTAPTAFADWTTVTPVSVAGTLLGQAIQLSGGAISPVPGSVVDGSSTLFSGPIYTPPLARSDAPELRATNPPAVYALTFGGQVVDPVLDLTSLGSTLTFPTGTQIVKRSGDAGLLVNGDAVSQAPGGPDVGGTIQFVGTFSSLTFSASYTQGQLDGIGFQVGASPVPPSPPAIVPPPPVALPALPAPVPPVAGVSVQAQLARGAVSVKLPGGGDFIPLKGAASLPVGSVVDARAGATTFTVATAGRTATATLAAGIFTIRQRQTAAPEFVLVTPAGKAGACAAAKGAARKGVVRRLSVVAKGRVRTVAAKGVTVTGSNASWTAADRCDGALTTVKKGRVSVRAGRRTIKLAKGQAYLLKAKLFAVRAGG